MSLRSQRSALLLCSAILASFSVFSCGDSDNGGSGGSTAELDPPGDGPVTTVPLLEGDCDPLAPTFCGLPFPSDVYRKTENGKSRLAFGATTLPRTGGSKPLDPKLFEDKDGFSVGSGIFTHMPGAQVDASMATPKSIALSVADGHPSFLIEADTGRKVPHWVDLDVSTKNDGVDGAADQRAIMIRAAERLKDGTRYIAGFRNVKRADGTVIEPTDAFKQLRDELPTKDYSVKRRRALYKDIFGKLEGAGIGKADLQIAWDFTTATKENTVGHMTAMRDSALAAIATAGYPYVVKEVNEDPGTPGIERRIVITVKMPHYLTYYAKEYNRTLFESKGGGPRMLLDDQGKPKQNTAEPTMDQDVLIIVPSSISDATKKHGLLQNGHGLFGGKEEGQGGYLARIAANYGWIAFSTDLFGFSGDDVSMAINALGARPELFNTFFDRQVQGMVNQLVAMRLMIEKIGKEGITQNGTVLLPAGSIDPALRAYRGDSQGGIMGTTYMAVTTDVTRGLLGEPGMPYSLLLNRSSDWPSYGLILNSSYNNDGLAVQLMINLIQQGWDRSEPIGYADFITDGSIANGTQHRVLIHPAIGDHQVSTFAAELIARSTGAVNMAADDGKVHREVFGLETKQGPITDKSAMVFYEFGLKDEPLTNLPPRDGCDPHDRVRDLTPSYEQQDEFFRTGSIGWHCNGVCNCDDVGKGPTEEGRCRETFESQCQ